MTTEESKVTEEEPQSTEERIGALEEVVTELIDRVEDIVKTIETVKKTAVTKPKGKFGGKRQRTPMKDVETGDIYISKAAVGKQFADKVGLEATNTFAWYTVEKQVRMKDGSPRFVEASPEEAAKAIADYDAQMAKEVAEANAKLEAEEAAKTEAAKKASESSKKK